MRTIWIFIGITAAAGCGDNLPRDSHGPIAPGISAPLGEPLPTASAEQLETFARAPSGTRAGART